MSSVSSSSPHGNVGGGDVGGGGGSKVLLMSLSRKGCSSQKSSSVCSCSGRPFLLERFGVLLCGVWVDLGGGVVRLLKMMRFRVGCSVRLDVG